MRHSPDQHSPGEGASSDPVSPRRTTRVRRNILLNFVCVVACAVAAALGIGAGAATLRLPPDIAYDRSPDSPGPVIFSHVNHVALAPSTEGECTGCHPEPFKMLKPSRHVTHDEMNAGKLCGTCHDGKTASGVQDDCEHCHKARSQSGYSARTGGTP
jgi:c(7)-type cytochrome triheme protein